MIYEYPGPEAAIRQGDIFVGLPRVDVSLRQLPYDEWYPLTAEELAEYTKRYPEAKPFPWQI